MPHDRPTTCRAEAMFGVLAHHRHAHQIRRAYSGVFAYYHARLLQVSSETKPHSCKFWRLTSLIVFARIGACHGFLWPAGHVMAPHRRYQTMSHLPLCVWGQSLRILSSSRALSANKLHSEVSTHFFRSLQFRSSSNIMSLSFHVCHWLRTIALLF